MLSQKCHRKSGFKEKELKLKSIYILWVKRFPQKLIFNLPTKNLLR